MRYETIVIGAGQAGLAMGYYLKQNNQRFLIIDKGKALGEVWKNRYDSLKLFTPRMYSSLPGLIIDGEQQGFPSKDEIANYIKRFTETFALPVELNTKVLSVTKNEEGFCVETTKGPYYASNVVAATGPFQKKRIPAFSSSLSENILQLHSSEYKNPNQLQQGNVLVVGGGNSGAQIAVELSENKDMYLAISKKTRYLPLIIGGMSVFWWFDKLGILKVTHQSFIGNLLQKKGDPIFGSELKNAIKDGEVTLKGRVVNGVIDHVIFEDSTTLEVKNIIWATGFQHEYEWLKIDGVIDKQNKIIHIRGVSPVQGLYFLGLPWQSRRGSSLLQGVGYDANYIIEHMKNTTT
ncbi:NAD(P)-binding domain-containing protein [Sporosarcina sp. Marseille-Q4063]|uniref:flavin-containing monooxygenase n=1 Tax=Sporosarcina sp. Marseille-Q4063 TaxID=2810514 RepID=UPI001BAE78CB|nr:NAD(P)/FAD-dependent oxidoreductase [Sporosarcina sp. Marseille-Q4063]QUW20947.1 NAD(P)-binding domain-containing protein [Sporosarcina sp. Marseille-Q4063]